MTLIIKHDAGFFSCCSVKLEKLIDYINTNYKTPKKIDGLELFSMCNPLMYKVEIYQPPLQPFKQQKRYIPTYQYDITFCFFDNPNMFEYMYTNKIKYSLWDQFKIYHNLNLEPILPIINKYFKPSKRIQSVANNFINRYNILTEECVAIL